MDAEEESQEILEEDQILRVYTLDENEDPNGAQNNDDDDELGETNVSDSQENPEESMERTWESELPQDTSICSFNQHSGDVFSVDFGLDFLAASGGEDDRGFIWNYQTGEFVLECSGHSDSVTWVRFNSKKTLLATGDMKGRIQIWNVAKREKVGEFSDAADLEWLCWHQSVDILFAGASDGIIWMWLIPTKDCRVFSAPGAACTSGTLLPAGKRLIAGYADGHVRIWDLKSGDSAKVSAGLAGQQSIHVGSVTCTDCSPQKQIGVSGASDGTFCVFNVDTAKSVAIFKVEAPKGKQEMPVSDEDNSERNSVETACFNPGANALATGTVRLDVWDLNAGVSKVTCDHPEGIVKAMWKNQETIVTACLDEILRLWDSRNGEMVKEWTGHQEEILDFAISEEFLLTGSGDMTAKLFRI